MRILLNVAEKPSVARAIANFLGGSESTITQGVSKFNPIYQFRYKIRGEEVYMKVTSVQGHIKQLNFPQEYQGWREVEPEDLFYAPIRKIVIPDKNLIVENLQKQAEGIDSLVLWLDCDREGENIAFEVIEVVSSAAMLTPSTILRAHFSALTKEDIVNACQNLGLPKKELSDAVEARQELDLRLGAAFTRLQTMHLRSTCAEIGATLLSWGPCQIPTLGFVAKRFLEIENFVPEPYWTIDMKVERPDGKIAKFSWDRERLFDFRVALVLYEMCVEKREAYVHTIERKEKTKYRPFPLSTIAFQKLVSSKLKIDSSEAMSIAEKLYNKGYISYPRTETDFFKTTINLRELVNAQTTSNDWGEFAKKLTENDFSWPRNGKNDDQSHPPIHPVKPCNRQDLTQNEWRVYELITRHFLACCSLDAKAYETTVVAVLEPELFTCKGLQVKELNYLEVYPYQKWAEADLPLFIENERFEPSEIYLNEHKTQPPPLLSESDLIGMMDKAGIGTDATIHQHIKTIQERKYAIKNLNGMFEPTGLGLGLYEGYKLMGTDLHEPELRAIMERNMNAIAAGRNSSRNFVSESIGEVTQKYSVIKSKMHVLREAITKRIRSLPTQQQVVVCFKCGEPGHYATNCTASNSRENQIKCFKCGKEGHYAPQCPGTTATAPIRRSRDTQKVCEFCGAIGRHPKGSTCEKVKRKRK